MRSCTRGATIYCLEEDCQFAILGRDDFNTIAGKAEKLKMMAKINFLQTFKIFQSFVGATLQKLTYFMEEQRYKIGNCVYYEGDQSDGVYLIYSGEFEISKQNFLKPKKK